MDSFGIRFLLLIRINECASTGSITYSRTHKHTLGWLVGWMVGRLLGFVLFDVVTLSHTK